MLIQPLPAKPHGAITLALGTLLVTFTLTLAYGSRELSSSPVPGESNPSVLELDPEIQKISETVVNEAVTRYGAQAGFAIVADPETGRVLAVANVDRRPNGRKEIHWSLSQLVRPASVMKALVCSPVTPVLILKQR